MFRGEARRKEATMRTKATGSRPAVWWRTTRGKRPIGRGFRGPASGRRPGWPYVGLLVGQYLEKDKRYPILVRRQPADRAQFAGQIDSPKVQPSLFSRSVPLSQVTRGFDLNREELEIWRCNRRRTITVEARTPDGVPASRPRDKVLPRLHEFKTYLSPGYRVAWGARMRIPATPSVP